MKTKITKLIIPVYLLSAVLAPFALFAGPASADGVLKGGVNETDIKKGDGPSLNRGDMGAGVDPFGGGEQKKDDGGGMLQAPPGSFDPASPFEGKPQPLSANANADGGDVPFKGANMSPQMENSNQPPTNMGTGNNAPMQGNATTPQDNDPEKSAQMQLLWDAWHKRVAETIYSRFNTSAQMLFKRSPPLACQVSYMVARDGRIGNVRILQPSANAIFNTMLLGVIHSIQGNAVLEYPPNSHRQFVEKTGTFTWNYTGGQGFKYTTGDHETIQQNQGRGK
jgi:hypothetical protein